MNGKVVIQVENLSKQYRLGSIGGATLREDLGRWWARMRGKPDPWAQIGSDNTQAHTEGAEFWALRDVSFEVREGEVLGVIGRNGAGKSTLLKILSRITTPTTGRATIRGRVGSLLEVGTGFHPELTGRENVYLNGTILGMTRAEITRKLDEIVEFAEMAKFIDTPVKRYSSGMTVRLAFAVAAHLDTDILFVDEVLAVGDQAFQEKSLSKMDEVSKTGRTVLFVSHNQGMVAKLCTRAIVLRSGQLIHEGDVAGSFVAYADAIRVDKAVHSGTMLGPLAETVELRVAELAHREAVWGAAVDPLLPLSVRVVIGLTSPLKGCGVRIDVKKGGVHLFSLKPLSGQEVDAESSLEMHTVMPAGLLSPGAYDLDLWVYGREYGRWACVRSFARFDVVARWTNDYVPNEAMGALNINAPVRLLADAAGRA
jgi:ABC-type polysaccharide/polyol phosphate transport system ATPase subunit